jgi:hypothetical protein
MSVVQIDVSDPINGPKIFDSLNSEQHPMTIGDLVRNEIFSKVADKDLHTIEQIDQNHWQPFYKRFHQGVGNIFDAYFFPYGLIHDPNLRKSEVYSSLKKAWQGIREPDQIIDALGEYQDAFIDIMSGSNRRKHSKSIRSLFKNLYNLGAPTSTYPFLMQISNAISDERVREDNGMAALEVIESFLVRRAICGHEPTGLHAVFKKLWHDCKGKPSKRSVIEQIRAHKTVAWPTDKEVKDAITRRPLYGAGITHYLVLEYDKSLGGDQPSDVPWIEHILPEKPQDAWFKDFTHPQHEALKDLLANLIPLSKEMNIDLSNGPYSKKRDTYAADSMFKSARHLARANKAWTPNSIERRSKELAGWAVVRWAY